MGDVVIVLVVGVVIVIVAILVIVAGRVSDVCKGVILYLFCLLLLLSQL